MGAAFFYALASFLVLLAADRFVRPVSRAAAIALILLPLLITGRALLTGAVYAPIDLAFAAEPLKAQAAEFGIGDIRNGVLSDVYSQIIPWHQAVRHAVGLREWPLWNPFMFAGDILAGAAQPAPYYPFNVLSWLIPLPQALTFLAAITLFNAALAAFLFLRELGCREEAALIGAAAWGLSDFLVFWNEWPLAVAASLLPLILLATRLVVVRHDRFSISFLALATVLLILAGYPQTVLHTALIAAIYGLYEIVAARGKHIVPIGTGALIACLLAIGLTAFYLLPFLEALPQTHEFEVRQQQSRIRSQAGSWPSASSELRKNLVPFVLGLPHDPTVPKRALLPASYSGSVALGLACCGVLFSGRRVRWLMLGFLVSGALAAASAPIPLHQLEHLPLFGVVIHSRLAFLSCLGLATLAALGADALLTEGPRRAAFTFGVLATVLMLALVRWWPEIAETLTWSRLLTHSALLVIPCAVAALGLFLTKGRATVLLLLLLLLGQRAAEGHGVYPTLPRSAFYPPIPEFQGLPRGGTLYRVVSQSYTWIPNISALYGFEDVRGYQAMTNLHWFNSYPLWCRHQLVHYNRVDDLTRPYLSLLNVRFGLSPLWLPVPDGWRTVTEGKSMRLLENPRALPRAFVPEFVRLGSSATDFHDMEQTSDFARRSWIAAWPRGSPRIPAEVRNGSGDVWIRREGLGYMLFTRLDAPAWVVVSETAWKGWRAIVDDQRRTPVFVANLALLGLHLPSGTHRVELRYRPDSFILGRGISLGTAGLISVLLLWIRFRHARRSGTAL
jgi:hypothetical protein